MFWFCLVRFVVLWCNFSLILYKITPLVNFQLSRYFTSFSFATLFFHFPSGNPHVWTSEQICHRWCYQCNTASNHSNFRQICFWTTCSCYNVNKSNHFHFCGFYYLIGGGTFIQRLSATSIAVSINSEYSNFVIVFDVVFCNNHFITAWRYSFQSMMIGIHHK